jgi:DNA repair exonuclease SbcCD ATPase subunit
LVIGGALYYITNYTGATYELKKANEELAASEKKLTEAEERRNEARSKSSQDAEDLKKAEELKKKYDELSAITNKSVEEEEEYKSVISEILETVPDIVEHYDEMNNKLTVTADLWDIILQRQREAAGKSAETALGASIAKYNAEIDNTKAQRTLWDVEKRTSEDILGKFDNAFQDTGFVLSDEDLKLWR